MAKRSNKKTEEVVAPEEAIAPESESVEKAASNKKPVVIKSMVDVVRIRKSNTKNSLYESEIGKAFIAEARKMAGNHKTVEDKEFFTIYQVIEA